MPLASRTLDNRARPLSVTVALIVSVGGIAALHTWGGVTPGLPLWLIEAWLVAGSVALALLATRSPTHRIDVALEAEPASTDVATIPIAHCLPDLVWRIDYANRTVTSLNEATAQFHPSACDGNGRLSGLFPARVSRQYLEALISVQSTQVQQQFEYRLGNGNESGQHVFEARLLPLSPGECLAVIRDITQMKATEEALFQQQLFVHQIIDSSPNLIFVRDKHGRFLLVNRATQTTLGHELLVQSHLAAHDQAMPFTTGDTEVLEHGETVRIVDHWTLPNGRTHWFDITKQPLVREGDVYILSIAIDITHVKAAEALIASSDPLSEGVADALPVPFMLLRKGIIEFVNNPFCERLNTPPTDLLGRPLEAITANSEQLLAESSPGTALEFLYHRDQKTHACRVQQIGTEEKTRTLLVLH
ncbi:PAS domain S-box-containing protein [Silvimonas terrae]|uniref:PAS domain S-box-containing protein n=1 Tax=Silvimonas terrae TaxID=300266 RepID=A0A840RB40_9NEIS|nr:PAS domain-containing protein [Silvimonas terrae]MBB5189560.1 PAS domain S-box-containing protein [Silvimonas terrae]